MHKKMKFSVKLVSKALDALEVGGNAGEATYKTEVCVVVGGGGGIGSDEMWSHEKFHNRIYIMREMYHTWKDNGSSLVGTEFEDKENDPFYDPPSDYLLGVARLQLEAIKYMLDVDEATPLVDYKGSSFGEIMVSMNPSVNDLEEGGADVEDLARIMGVVGTNAGEELTDEEVEDFKQQMGGRDEMGIDEFVQMLVDC